MDWAKTAVSFVIWCIIYWKVYSSLKYYFFPCGSRSSLCQHMRSMRCRNTLALRKNCRHFTDDIFKCIFLDENVQISIKISPKFVPKGPIDNIPALVQIMAWCGSDGKPLSEPMKVSLLMHICITRPQWVQISFPISNILRPKQDGCHFCIADSIFICIFLNENF